MINAKEATVWVNNKTKQVMISGRSGRPSGGEWGDPIGAAYSEWAEMSDSERARLMLETAVDLAMQGFDLKHVLVNFAEVIEFRALGSESYPMCRALTSALVGRCLEPNTMSFEEFLQTYKNKA